MKRFIVTATIIGLSFMSCQQSPILEQPKVLGAFELNFDLETKTARLASQVQTRAVVNPSQLSVIAAGPLQVITDTARNVDYISATFNISNIGISIQDLTFIAYKKTNNVGETAFRRSFGGGLANNISDSYAESIQPVNTPISLNPFVTNNSLADLQLFKESEISNLQAELQLSGTLSATEYLFPYGFVARRDNTSRLISLSGKITVALKLPRLNGVNNSNLLNSMSLIAVSEPLGVNRFRVSESYEERHGTSSVATRASNFGISASNIAYNSAATLSSGTSVNGVRTAGSKTAVKRINGEKALTFGSNLYDSARGVATDKDGNVYITGETLGTLDLAQPNPEMTGITSDLIVAKYNSSGVKQWTQQLGTNRNESGEAIGVDIDGNVYVAGYTDTDLDGIGGQDHQGRRDVILVKYNSSGVKQWMRQTGTLQDDSAKDITFDSSGNIYFMEVWGSALGGNGASAVIQKYSNTGSHIWTRVFNSSSSQFYGQSIAFDPNGFIYVVINTPQTIVGNPNSGMRDIILAKYNLDGAIQWYQQFGTASLDLGYGVAADSNGNAYITGHSQGDMDLTGPQTNAGGSDVFLTKFNSSGTRQWTQQFGNSNGNGTSDIAIDASNNLFVTGITNNLFELNTAGPDYGFLAKYNSNGTKLWTNVITPSTFYFAKLALDPNGHIYVSGTTTEGFAGATSTLGNADLLLLRFDALQNIYN
jgi:hypothetical protein